MVKSKVKSKAINTLVILTILPILFLALVFHIDALPDGYVNTFDNSSNNACYTDKLESKSECKSTAKSQMTVENRVYVAECLHCADWATNYEGCGSYITKEYETPMGKTTLSDLHEQCKYPVVYYRTTKGYSTAKPKNDAERGVKITDPDVNGTAFKKVYDAAILTKNNDRYIAYNRCDTITDIVHTKCKFIYGSACQVCEGSHCCNNSAQYDKKTGEFLGCSEGECRNHMCTGVNIMGDPVHGKCAEVDHCTDCHNILEDDEWAEKHQKAAEQIVKWVCGIMPLDTVNTDCDTTYGVKYDVDICTSAKVKTSNYICQKKYQMNIGGNIVDAYCINPEYASAGDVLPDETFDVTTCETSISTRNCGFANILIEGYLRKELGE